MTGRSLACWAIALGATMTSSDRCVSVHNKMRAADKKSTAREIKPFNKALEQALQQSLFSNRLPDVMRQP